MSVKSYVYEDCFEVYRGFCKKRLGMYGKFKLQQLVRPVEFQGSAANVGAMTLTMECVALCPSISRQVLVTAAGCAQLGII